MSKREIGGYFELEHFSGKHYHDGAIKLNCGRACLEYLIKLRGIRKILLPDYLCDSVSSLCCRCGLEIKTYSVNESFLPEGLGDIEEGWLYLVDYYGQLVDESIQSYAEQCSGRIIIDESQNFFAGQRMGLDTLYTCRKWFGVSDGAYLYTAHSDRLNAHIPQAKSAQSMGYLLGRFESNASSFFTASKANNKRFCDEPLQTMSVLTDNILCGIDYGRVQATRNENYEVVCEALSGINQLRNLKRPAVPFMYPLLVDGAQRIREHAAKRLVYIPTLWPNVIERSASGEIARRYSTDILPLPIDQRYDLQDMQRMIEVVRECML